MATSTDTIPVAEHDRGPFVAPDTEREALERAARALNQSESGSVKLITNNGKEIELSPTLLRVLRQGAAILAADRAVVVESIGKLVTPRQAAELVGVHVHHLERLLDTGELPFENEGPVRLLPLDDVLAYRQVFKARQHEGLDELARISQEMGLYDLDYSTIKIKRLLEFDEEERQADSDEN